MSWSGRHALSVVALVLASLVAIGILLYYLFVVVRAIPISLSIVFDLVVAFALGVAAITIVGRLLEQFVPRLKNTRRGALILVVYRFAAYAILAFVLLVILGVDNIALLTGGTFAGLVVGLAAQSVLSNVFGGVLLILSQPMNPGDRVTILTWQYGVVVPIYPPKYYSTDYVIPGYTGTVVDFGLVYTRLRMDEGTEIRFPNGILVQAAVISHETQRRWIKVRYEIPNRQDPEAVLARVREAVEKNRWLVSPSSLEIYVHQGTLTTYVIGIDALCHGNREDPPRSAILIDVIRAVGELPAPRPLPAGAPPSAGPGPATPPTDP